MGWSPGEYRDRHGNKEVKFQSLRGFGVGWSRHQLPGLPGFNDVSIPERVWGGLEREGAIATRYSHLVSIPERVWGGLEPMDDGLTPALLVVSIPERVWGGLERHRSAR